jgi:hypothetical protein
VGYDLLASVFFVFLTPVVIAGFCVFWMVNARDHEALASTWRAYARVRGLDFVAPEGEWPNRSSAAVAWKSGEAELRFTTVGREARIRTRLTVKPRETLLGSVVWVCDEAFAGRIRTEERPPGFAQRIVSAGVQRALLGLRQRDRVTLSYRRGRVTIEWPGGELNDARLDDARRLGEEVARAIAEEFRATARVARPAA